MNKNNSVDLNTNNNIKVPVYKKKRAVIPLNVFYKIYASLVIWNIPFKIWTKNKVIYTTNYTQDGNNIDLCLEEREQIDTVRKIVVICNKLGQEGKVKHLISEFHSFSWYKMRKGRIGIHSIEIKEVEK